MSPPVCQVNNFVQPKRKNINKIKKNKIDSISKTFIILDLVLGVNRISLITVDKKLFILMTFHYVFINVALFYVVWISIKKPSDYLTIISIYQVFMYTTLGGIFRARLFKFYNELNKFDDDIGIKDISYKDAQYNLWFLLVTVTCSLLCYGFMFNKRYFNFPIYMIVVLYTTLQALELHYYGHLFSLMIPRIRLIINYFKLSYPNRHRNNDLGQELKKVKKQNYKYSHMDLQKLTNFYDKVIIIYDYLNSAIKWQMVTLLALTFIVTLFLSYFAAKGIINGTKSKSLLCIDFLSLAMKITHILVPCIFSERVHNEACRLKELLACRLYENTLDKTSRSAARTLLTLIETRDLSFSLFHMFNVDIALPFKFLALLLTYLVILLQFDKVINP